MIRCNETRIGRESVIKLSVRINSRVDSQSVINHRHLVIVRRDHGVTTTEMVIHRKREKSLRADPVESLPLCSQRVAGFRIIAASWGLSFSGQRPGDDKAYTRTHVV